ncbi:MAG: hypothetical protein AABN95_10270 [Acidobacteriota bacterium]
MKRCSECDFTFDDYQQICDFDGTELRVVPEPIPFFKDISIRRTVSPASSSRLLRIVRSRVFMAGLALAAVMLSALLIGYYESANSVGEAESAEANSDAEVSQLSPAQVDKPDQLERSNPIESPRLLTMERRVTGAEESSIPSSMIKWPTEDSQSRSSRARSSGSQLDQSTAKVPAKLSVTRRASDPADRPSRAGNQKSGPGKSNRQSYARNTSEDRDQRPNAARVANRRPRGESAAREQKESKVVAILKKTGSILTWPFKF